MEFICNAQDTLYLDEEHLEPLTFNEVYSPAHRTRLGLYPRSHLKTTLVSVAYPLWRIYRNPNIRIAIGANALELSRRIIREIKSHLEDSTLKQYVWNARPHYIGDLIPVLDAAGRRLRNQSRDYDTTNAADKRTVWNADELSVIRPAILKEPTLTTLSVGKINTGQHYDLFIGDDLVDWKNSDTEEKAEKVFRWVNDIASVVDPPRCVKVGETNVVFYEALGEEFIYLGTRYFEWDLYNSWIKLAKEELEDDVELADVNTRLMIDVIIKNIYRNGVDGSAGMLWWEKHTEAYFTRVRKRLKNDKVFFAQYHNEMTAGESRPLKSEQVIELPASSYKIENGVFIAKKYPEVEWSTLGTPEAEELFCVANIMTVTDMAGNQNEGSCKSSISVVAYDQWLNYYVLDTFTNNNDLSVIADKLYEFRAIYKPFKNVIEIQGSEGHTFVNYIKKLWQTDRMKYPPIYIEPYTTNRISKVARIIASLQPLLTTGRLFAVSRIYRSDLIQKSFNLFPSALDLDTIDTIAIGAEVGSRSFKDVKTALRKRDPRKVIRRGSGFPINDEFGGIAI